MDTAALTYKLVSERLKGCKAEDFAKRYEEDVSDLSDLCVAQRFVDGLEIYVLQNGFVAVYRCKSARWSLYESQQRVEGREHLANWASFARGCWVSRTPQEEGVYFVRSLDGRRSVRELARVGGKLRDISGGFVRAGRVTEWAGDWWMPKVPQLPGAI